MFSKTFLASVTIVALSLQVHGHAGITPALGVKGQLARNDVQRPSDGKPCGNVNIAQVLDTSTPVNADADGSFTTTVTDFNAGKDGSRQVKVQIDPAATGKKFVDAKVTKNGDAAPAKTGSEKVVAQLPAGTKCKGGKAGNLCLASFKTTAGFGNCVVVRQSAAKGTANDAAVNDASAAKPSKEVAFQSKGSKKNRPVVGTRAPRAIRRAGAPAS